MAYRKYGATRDPYWLAARYGSDCSGCSKRISKGARIFYFPKSRKAFCETCGQAEERPLVAARSYERYGSDCMYDC